MTIETDYLVVGAGMAGMGFVDSLLDAGDADVVMVDRRHAPGGHWLDTYPFVRLHQPSSWYGVGSASLDDERVDADGPEAGQYSRVSGIELQAYFARVMRDRFLASGRVRFLPMAEHLGDGRVRHLLNGHESEVRARRKIVDATYTPSETPETSPPPFEVDDGVRVVTPAGLTRLRGGVDRVVVVGTGKTAMDTCVWLLEQGYDPDAITWVRNRDAWLLNRAFVQPGHLAGQTVIGTVHWLEAIAAASSVDDVLEWAERTQVALRIDPEVWPMVFRGPTISEGEIAQLRRIRDVVRLGKVTRIEPDRLVLERGEVATTPGTVHVHCATSGLTYNPALPVFTDDRITIQYLSRSSMSLSSAAIARVEALELPLAEKNALCPPTPLYNTPLGYLQMLMAGLVTENLWRKRPELSTWFDAARMNVTRTASGEELAPWYGRLLTAIGPAQQRLAEFSG